MQNLQKALVEILKNESTYFSEGRLLKNKLTEDAFKLEPRLIKYILSNNRLKKAFFLDIDGVLVFDKDKFIQFMNNKRFLPDSYTSFKNRIGLLDENGDYFKEKKDVVLVWPYKDCVLEGGQDKEDEKRNEIFYNEILAPDEIDRLFDPKVLTNFKRYDKDGEHLNPKDISRNDNLIIKGNNLLALHSLKKCLAGKVKLIYIDPPYNRGNERDDFLYNDSFKHSSWLVFMKNRLEVSWELLTNNEGFIWISISDEEAHYLKVLCDEVFGRDNFVADVIWNSTKSVTNTAVISDAHTHNLLYVKNIGWLKKNRHNFRLEADESKFSNPDNDPRGKWVADPFQVGGIRPNQRYPIKNPKTGKVYLPLPGNSWKNEKKVFDELIKDGRIIFGVSGEAGPQRKRFWSEARERGEVTTTLWTDLPTTTNATRHLKELFGEKVFDNPKPEGLIQRIIKLSTKEGDIVLDFFAGSGTTAATAIKMKRQFITCEQMSYVDNVTVQRLKKVIQGEQGGISKSVGWKGWGSFVYCKLKKWNQSYIEEIEMAKTTKDLLAIYEKMKKEAFFRYDVDLSKFDEKEFEKIALEQQKEVLIECLDKNHLYVNLSEIDDATYEISEEDKEMNRKFYGV